MVPEDPVDPPGLDLPVWKNQSRRLFRDNGSSRKSNIDRLESSDTLWLKLTTEAKASNRG